jgi:hypothetical protein
MSEDTGLSLVWRWTKRYARNLAVIGGLALLGSLATLALPWLAAQLAVGIAGDDAVNLGQTLTLLGAA